MKLLKATLLSLLILLISGCSLTVVGMVLFP